MKYLKTYESYSEIDTSELKSKSLEYLKKLPKSEIDKIIRELEDFAFKNNINFQDLEDPEVVKNILLKNRVDEGLSDWWYSVISKLSKYTKIFSAITFITSLIGWYGFEIETLPLVKVSAAAYIISNLVSTLKGLKDD